MFDWRKGVLGELAAGIRGVSYTPSQLLEFKTANTVTLLRSNNIQSGFLQLENTQIVPRSAVSEAQKLRWGDIAVCMSNGSKALVGKAGPFSERTDEQFTVGAFCSIFRAVEGANQKFLKYVFQSGSYRAQLDISLAGSAINNLRNSEMELFAMAIPPPDQQEAIAKVLDSLDIAIRQTEAIIEKLKLVKQGLLHDLLTRGIDANGELRPPQSQAANLYKESPLGWIPIDWDIELLGKKAEISGGVTLGRSISGSGVVELPYLRVANVQDGYLDLAEIKRIRVLVSEIPRFKLECGDVLMNEGGDFDKLGRGAIWSGQIDECLHQNHVFRVRCEQSSLNSHYLTAYSGSAFGRAFFVRASKQTTNLASINSTQLKGFPLRLPPLAEQVEINKRLCAVDSRIDAERLACNKLQNQKTGLMDDLLTGRVRVTPLLQGTTS